MELKNIEQAQSLFPDAVKLQLRVNKTITEKEVRRLLPNSVVLLSCKISKNYANVIYSEGAAKRLFPDVTTIREKIELGNGQEANIYVGGTKAAVKVLVNFLPNSNKTFISRLEQAFGVNLIQISSYPEVNMGCLFFHNVRIEDLVGVLTICKEDVKESINKTKDRKELI